MTDQAIFNDTNQQPNTGNPSTPPSDNPFADKLGAIKNEDGKQKYNTVEDALDALNHSQQFIETLKAEKAAIEADKQTLESELATRQSVQDVVENLTKNQTPPQTPQADPQGEANGLNEDKVLELVQNVLNQTKQSDVKQSNVQRVVNTLSETYGDKATQVVSDRAKELGTTPSALQELAENNPEVVLSLFKDVKVQSSSPVQTSQRVSTTQQTKEPELPKLEEKLITGGATNEQLVDAWRKAQEYTYEKLGVES